MNISYKREMRHNFLILEAMEEEESFEARMLIGNSIEGLLKFRVKQEEKARFYYYEITSKQPLSRLLEFKEIEKEELSTLIVEIGLVLKRIEDYLLSEANLFLEPEHIYIEPESFQVWLCYIPGYEKNFPDAMEKLLQYLLKKTNHKDNDTVVLAYRLYQESQKDYYGIEDLLRIVRESQQGTLREPAEKGRKRSIEEKQNEGKVEKQKEIRNFDENNQEKQKSQWESENNRKEAKRIIQEKSEKSTWLKEIKIVVGLMGMVCSAPLFVWLYAGTAALRQYRTGLFMIDGIAVCGTFVYLLWKRRWRYSVKEKEKRKEKREDWQMTFEREYDEGGFLESEEEKDSIADNGSAENSPWECVSYQDIEGQEAENTVLLAEASLEGDALHLLKSVNPSFDDISLSYFPFIIGKQDGIVDYVLKKDTISRIHLRIDEEDGCCKVTDLNSSNGTVVGDHRLEANESCILCSGDKLVIADIPFIFY